MLASFDSLWERLLQRGVRPRHARRYLAELQDHLDDLVGQERRALIGERDARSRARLGSAEMLAGAMIARRELRAWSSKAPVATYLIAPSLALAAGTALAMAGVVIVFAWFMSADGVPSDPPSWSRSLSACVVFLSNTMLSVLLGWALGAMAIRHRSAPLWPVLGIVILAAVGAAIQVGVMLPSAIGHGEIEFSSSFGSLSDWVDYAGRLALNLTLILTPQTGLSLWRAAQPGGDKAGA